MKLKSLNEATERIPRGWTVDKSSSWYNYYVNDEYEIGVGITDNEESKFVEIGLAGKRNYAARFVRDLTNEEILNIISSGAKKAESAIPRPSAGEILATQSDKVFNKYIGNALGGATRR